jgi:SAM-dependent methyltransferase
MNFWAVRTAHGLKGMKRPMERSVQDDVFTAFEGDRWFDRNKGALAHFDPCSDLPLKLVELYGLQPRRVLEVGASNGFRLAAIADRYGASVVGLEPSAHAIVDGKARFPAVRFLQGEASDVALAEQFDLIIVNFVFHWIDRTRLLRTVAETDRLLLDGGYLVIGDFYPSNPIKVRYHHLPDQEMYTYKQDYAATYLASGLYHRVGTLTGDHASKSLDGTVSESQRIGVSLLRKRLEEHYAFGTV